MQIDIWSDFACPWCALGLYRLDAAREQFAHGDAITVTHRSFELDPHAPARRPQTMEQVLASKYGMSPEQVQAGHERLTSFGHEVGMEFNFDRIQLGNTFDAHRLAQAARGTEVEDALVKQLFAAYFTQGRLLSDRAVLLEAAVAAGLDSDIAAKVLDDDLHAEDVRADEAAAQEMGVTGVPYFLIDGKWAVPGAQDVETLVLVLQRAWDRATATA
ncbi:MAG TPA: DsbA family oxidoreductase [Acidimicrobiales bacterium]|jgi:predicted DsbA family dithiol-disulfide isomerase|nr:DsbA family oxidoreductase [Acidimicrobiales bacterium]